MNATERARISDAYYSGTTSKREVCDAAALLREENENLRAENDRLCAEVEALKRDEWAAGFSAGCDAVEAAYEDGMPYYEVEIAKLRELLKEHGIEVA